MRHQRCIGRLIERNFDGLSAYFLRAPMTAATGCRAGTKGAAAVITLPAPLRTWLSFNFSSGVCSEKSILERFKLASSQFLHALNARLANLRCLTCVAFAAAALPPLPPPPSRCAVLRVLRLSPCVSSNSAFVCGVGVRWGVVPPLSTVFITKFRLYFPDGCGPC